MEKAIIKKNLNHPSYTLCKENLYNLYDNIKKIEHIKQEPEFYIAEYFSEVEGQICSRAETMKTNIDNIAQSMIKHIRSAQNECMASVTKMKYLSIDLEKSKNSLSKLLNRFERPNINESQCDSIISSLETVKLDIQNKFTVFKSLLLNDLEIKFNYIDYNIEDVFGSINTVSCLI